VLLISFLIGFLVVPFAVTVFPFPFSRKFQSGKHVHNLLRIKS